METERDKIPEDLVPDRAGLATRTNHRDGARCEQTSDRCRFGVLFPSLDRGDGGDRRRDREVDSNGSFVEVALGSPARVGEDVQHLVIARQRVGGEGMNTPGARDYRQVLEQNRAEAAALLVIRHRERDLGFALGRAVVSRNRDDLIAQLRDEDHPIPIVDVRDVLELRGSRARNG